VRSRIQADGLPAARVPCASRKTRRDPKLAVRKKRERLKQGSLHPRFAAMLGCANGLNPAAHSSPGQLLAGLIEAGIVGQTSNPLFR